MPTIDQILDAEATLRAARVTVDQVQPGDRVIIHRAPPGDFICSLSSPATVTGAFPLQPDVIYPNACWVVETTLDTGEAHNFSCSARFSLLRAAA